MLDAIAVSIPDRDFSWFQPKSFKYKVNDRVEFQSLIGILVDFNFYHWGNNARNGVSIPDRDFSWFQHLVALRFWLSITLFQSLIGILVDFNAISSFA